MTKPLWAAPSDAAGVSALTLFLPLYDFAAQSGVNAAAILSSFELAPADLHDPLRRLSPRLFARFAEQIGEQLGTTIFHLRVAELAMPGSFDLPEVVLRCAPTVRDQLQSTAALARLFFCSAMSFTVDGEDAILSLSCPEPSPDGAMAAETFITRVLTILRQTTGLPVRPRELRLQTAAPAWHAELERIVDAPVRHRHRSNELIFGAAWLDQPNRSGDARMYRTLTRVAGELIERLPVVERFSQRVRATILQALPDHDPSVDQVAHSLCMSPRTLQRRLSQENTSYQRVLDRVRLELSIEYIAMSRMPLSEAALKLGFSDLTSFHRAFKRWTGTPPAEFRKQYWSSGKPSPSSA
jgi:AraC-like DNA-binding protein